MKPIVSMTLADLARGVGVIMAHMINTTHIMNPKAYRDWSWIVHPNRNLPEGLVEVTRKYHENVIEKRVMDYNENKKKIDKILTDLAKSSRMNLYEALILISLGAPIDPPASGIHVCPHYTPTKARLLSVLSHTAPLTFHSFYTLHLVRLFLLLCQSPLLG
ncbi:hypothetical protein FF1_025335 [Malus domestica]